MNLLQRYSLFFAGLFFMALGICIIIASSLGSSPISSVPYVLVFCYPLTLGGYTLLMNLLFIIMQPIILRRFQASHLLQLPTTFIFSLLIDFSMPFAAALPAESYLAKLLLLLVGCVLMAFGLTCELVANVAMPAADGFINTIVTKWKLNFGYTKVAFDCTLLLTAAIISYTHLNEITGIREGTLISALLVGHILRFFMKKLVYTDASGTLHFKACHNPSDKSAEIR